MLDLPVKPAPARARRHSALTVGDVIAMLQTFDPSAPVMLRGEEGGFLEVAGFRAVPVRLNVNTAEGYGPHEVPEVGQPADVTAVVVRVGG